MDYRLFAFNWGERVQILGSTLELPPLAQASTRRMLCRNTPTLTVVRGHSEGQPVGESATASNSPGDATR